MLQATGQGGLVTVREQLRQFAGLYPRPRDVDEVLAAVGLEAQAKTRISRLSGGQQRRVDVALGIIGRPELLFLDEPTTGFDPHARREFWELIRRLKREGTTILLTTHYLDEAAQLADRVAVIAAGRLRPSARSTRSAAKRRGSRSCAGSREGAVREQRSRIRSISRPRSRRAWVGLPPASRSSGPSLEDIYLGLVAEAIAHDAAESAALATEAAR